MHVRGKVSESRSAISPYPGRLGSQVETPAEEPASPVREVALYLEAEGATAPVDSTDVPQMKQVRLRFEPRVLVIPAGTTVAFPNLDPVFHNVFSYSSAKRFDLGRYPKGHSKSVTFEKPGLVRVFCDVHSSMSAHILVVDTEHVAQPDASGRFVLEDVPEGRHTLTLWHPDLGEREVVVRVGEGTTHVELDF